MSKCPKCSRPLFIENIDDEITYLRVVLACEGSNRTTDRSYAPDCDFREVREIDIDNIRKYGNLKGG